MMTQTLQRARNRRPIRTGDHRVLRRADLPARGRTPTGPAAAALLAAGVGSAVFGVTVVASAMSDSIKQWMTWHGPAGSLSGKSTVAAIAFALTLSVGWAALRRKDPDIGPWVRWSIGLVCVGVVLTFPPVFELFHGGV